MTSLLRHTPVIGPTSIQPRDYQRDAISCIANEFRSGKRSTLLVMATGLGKTVTFGWLARKQAEHGRRTLILAHRGELIDQAVNTLDRLGVDCGIEKADQHARALFEPMVVVATVQTLQGDRLASWPRDYFYTIITDEAHHATAETYCRIYRHFSKAYHLGVTATPDRADEDNLGSVFESVAFELGLIDAIKSNHLAPIRVAICDVSIDLRDIRTTGGDFNAGDLESRITPIIDTLANAIRQEAGDRQTLIFTPDVGSAQAMGSALQSMGLKADWTAGADPARGDKVRAYKAGESQFLASCMLLTEGFDAPQTSAIALCRPTKSRALYSQMVGRGTRRAEGKENCLLIDFNYLTSKHDLVKATDLFDTTHTDSEVIELAGKSLKPGRQVDLFEAIEDAEKKHKEMQVLRVRAKERAVSYRRVSYDILDVYDTMGLAWRGPKDAVINVASPKQQALLKKFGVEGSERISKERAATLLDYFFSRMKAGLATQKQVAHLIANGIDAAKAREMSKAEASEHLSNLWRKGA